MLFVPIGFLDDRRPLPHEEALRVLGVVNETIDWGELAELEAGGIRIESHGIGHRPVSELEPGEALREIALSKLRLEERLGRRVDAFAFVKGSHADYRPEHASLVQQAGYELAFTSVSGANGPRATVSGSAATTSSRTPRGRSSSSSQAPATSSRSRTRCSGRMHGGRSTPRSEPPPGEYAMSFETVRYTRERRADLVALLARVGTTQLTDEEFAWWFDRNPAGEGIVSLAVDGGEVVGVAAMSFFRTALDGDVTRLAIPVNVATDPRYRGQGVFSTLEQENERAASDAGSPLTVTFPNGASYPIFVTRLGWIDLPRLRLWARPLRVGAVARYLLGRPGEHGGLRASDDSATTTHGVEVRAGRSLRPGPRRSGRARGSRVRQPLRP